MPTLSLLLALIAPAHAQQVIQIPLCGGSMPSSINPSSPTIAVNPSGQVCIAGSFSATVPTPTVAIPSPLTITIYPSQVLSGAYVDGSIVTIGTTTDSAALSPTANSTVISLLKAILTNVLSPINVTGSFSTTVSSPLGVNIASTTPINVTVGGIVSPQNVTVASSPVAVTIASSPINVTGNFTTAQTGQNIAQLAGQTLASPTTFGVAPVGSVQGVNAFVTNNVNVTTPTPLQVTLPASPISVGIAGPTPLNVTIAASPLNVTQVGQSGQNINVVQVQGVAVASPSTYGAAPVGSVQGVNAFVTNNVNVTTPTPLQVTLPASPISVGIAGPTPLNVTVGSSPVAVTIASSPVNVTGNFTSTQTGTNLVQISGQQIASPSTYGVAPVGSVQGMNAFVTNQPTVVLSGSPVSVGIAGPTPLNVTLATSPVSVAISTVSSPINVTGSFTATPASPQNTNLVQVDGQQIASPTTYGIAPVGSVQGINAFVTNNVNVTTPTPLQITLPASPISVGISATPLNVTLATSPVSVAISTVSSPINVTGNFSSTPASPQNTNLVQIQGVTVASASTYGVAPVGSVQGVNAFVTNNVNVTTPTPLQTTMPASPLAVQLITSSGAGGPSSATPLNVTLVALPGTPISVVQTQSPQSVVLINASPQAQNIVQVQNVNIASPSTYGVAPVGSTQGMNAFVTNGNPNGSATSANSQPVVIASDQTPLNITISGSPQSVILASSASPQGIAPATQISVNLLGGATIGANAATNGNVIAWTASQSSLITNAALAIGATPGIVGIHQLNGANCNVAAQGVATPQTAFLEVFDATPHATGSDVTLGTTIPKMVLPIATSASTPSMNPFIVGAPGVGFSKGITVAFTTTAKGVTSVGVNLVCTFVYN